MVHERRGVSILVRGSVGEVYRDGSKTKRIEV